MAILKSTNAASFAALRQIQSRIDTTATTRACSACEIVMSTIPGMRRVAEDENVCEGCLPITGQMALYFCALTVTSPFWGCPSLHTSAVRRRKPRKSDDGVIGESNRIQEQTNQWRPVVGKHKERRSLTRLGEINYATNREESRGMNKKNLRLKATVSAHLGASDKNATHIGGDCSNWPRGSRQCTRCARLW